MVRFNLKFIQSTTPKVHGPVANIYIDQSAGTDDGRVLITSKCLTNYEEVEKEVDSLIKELNEIKKIAKKKFSDQ